jgi:hypothetical protein
MSARLGDRRRNTEYWQLCAQQACIRGEQTTDTASKATMSYLADSYARMAQRAAEWETEAVIESD